jgi:hypothetical protein
MKLNKYTPISFVYFFVNSVGLPLGLLYTTLLSPLLYLWLLMKGHRYVILKFVLLILPFAVIHYLNGVIIKDYLRSTALLLITYIFVYAFYVFVSRYQHLEKLLRQLLLVNFVLTIIAVIAFFTPYKMMFWSVYKLTEGVRDFPRLSMFTYEPSYYATLLVPIGFFYFLRIFFRQLKKGTGIIVCMMVLPFVLSFSIGVMGAMLMSVTVLLLFNSSGFVMKKIVFYPLFGIGFLLLFALVVLYLYFPANPLFTRLQNVYHGIDTSARGRTIDAFQISWIIANFKSIWWGIGPGQIKTAGYEAITAFYNYPEGFPAVRIPNAFAETFAIFGFVGAGLRLFAEIYLFFKTRVWNNYYRFLLFFFIFFYQFTGSFITNIAEYVIWALAFSNVFPFFNRDAVRFERESQLRPLQE